MGLNLEDLDRGRYQQTINQTTVCAFVFHWDFHDFYCYKRVKISDGIDQGCRMVNDLLYNASNYRLGYHFLW
ncbi:uncharacterized protein LOC111103197 isoform X2 [Crassostrea virginica]